MTQVARRGAESLLSRADGAQATVGRSPSATRWDALREKWGIEVAGEFTTAYDDRGVYFTTLMSGGPKTEGDPVPALFASADLAWEAYERALLEWLGDTRRVNVRRAPECDSEAYTSGGFSYEFWTVYSRLSKVPA